MQKIVGWGFVLLTLCAAISCSEDEGGVTSVAPEIRGGRGESCLARNDCRDGLACINNVCTQNDFDIAVSAKTCERIECEAAEDCCPNATSSACTMLKSDCDAGDTIACSSWETSCSCSFTCEANRCVSNQTCTSDSSCFGSLARRCVEQKCVECATDTDCSFSGDGSKCVANRCTEGCETNDDCPIFNTCTDGACVESGCSTDRECYLATKNPRAKCLEKKCQIPCEVDAECPSLSMCESGNCLFVGCESNEECKLILASEGALSVDGKAVCK